ncbi:hypothetical protein ABFS83_14G088400 [Erythranthe nasuta]
MEKDTIPSDSVAPISTVGNADVQSASEQSVQYYDYCNTPVGYNGTLPQFDDKDCSKTAVGGSYTGTQPDYNDALSTYYASGYGGTYRTYTPPPEYLQQPSGYGGAYDSTYFVAAPSGSGSSNGRADNNNNTLFSNTSPQLTIHQNQITFGTGYQYEGPTTGSYPTVRNSRDSAQYGPSNYEPNNQRYKGRDNFRRSGENKAEMELTCGPRVNRANNSSSKSTSEEEQIGLPAKVDKFNLQDFQTVYENAKFYVIKSYSEDDIHKSIKYDVWSSTPNGNLKLDAAFNEANARQNCPVFLFFSVNASGQFVGVAEMIGHVDFSKSMDFWQLDKWNGFFPLQWHIVKDVPNTLLRHIILENNDNRPVTFTRDTQEIGLKQGLEMLSIFKNHSGKKSLLDDYSFYEKREKELKAKRKNAARSASSQNHGFENGDYRVLEYGEGVKREISGKKTDASSLVSLTMNLSLNS